MIPLVENRLRYNHRSLKLEGTLEVRRLGLPLDSDEKAKALRGKEFSQVLQEVEEPTLECIL